MDYIELGLDDTLDERCAEVFLSRKGYLIFICTLCDCVIKGFPQYLSHITKNHYSSLDDEENSSTKNAIEDEVEKAPSIKSEEFLKLNAEIKLEVQIENDSIGVIDSQIESEELKVKQEENEELQGDELSVDDDLSNFAESLESTSEIEKVVNKKTSSPPAKIKRRSYQKIPEDSAERKYKCDKCGFGFRDPSNLYVHIRRHSDDKKRHACNTCTKRFHSRTELKTHIRSHTKERPYLCTNCGQAFITSSALSTHLKRHTDIRNSKCVICDKSFYDDALLRDHMTVHTGERTHACSHCNATFSRRKALACHMKLHENKLEYKCELCSARFNQKPGLYSHMKSKHKVTPPVSTKSIAVAKRSQNISHIKKMD